MLRGTHRTGIIQLMADKSVQRGRKIKFSSTVLMKLYKEKSPGRVGTTGALVVSAANRATGRFVLSGVVAGILTTGVDPSPSIWPLCQAPVISIASLEKVLTISRVALCEPPVIRIWRHFC